MRLGNVGDDVAAWRDVLELDGYDLSGSALLGADGESNVARVFTTAVHNATVAWQKARGLKGDGVVGDQTRNAIAASPLSRPRAVLDPVAIPYVEAANWSRHIGPQLKSVIVIHCMEYPEASTSAEWCASYFAGKQGAAPQASAHYCVDDDTVVCCVPPDRIAWHAPGANANGLGIEHAGYARQNRQQWLDDFSLRMLALSGQLTAHLCDRFDIPVSYLVADQLRRGARGITTHAEVSKAFGRSTHMDPGPYFPVGEYLRFVDDALRGA